jgi:DNA polymerase
VTLGNIGLQRLLGREYTVSKVHGTLLTSSVYQLETPFDMHRPRWSRTTQTFHIVPMNHPAAVLYRPQLAEKVEEDWEKLKEHYVRLKP